MRMWMIDPSKMCIRHIVGEHGEIHKHRHVFEKGHSILRRVLPEDVQIEPGAMKKRHDELSKYLKNHKSPYEMPSLDLIPIEHRTAKVDVQKSMKILADRCPACRALLYPRRDNEKDMEKDT